MVVTTRGLGKCSQVGDYRVQARKGKGLITLNRTERTGDVVALMEVLAEDEVMIITRAGKVIRSPVSQVRVAGRNTQGVKLVEVDKGDEVSAVARVVPDDKPSPEGAGADAEAPVGPDEPEQLDLGDVG